MALENYEILAVVGRSFLKASDALKDKKLSPAEIADLVSSTIVDLTKEFMDDEDTN